MCEYVCVSMHVSVCMCEYVCMVCSRVCVYALYGV